VKRFFDITLVILTVWLWLPVMLITGLLVFCLLGCPIFFVQERPGLHGMPFSLIKFRTMLAGDAGDAHRMTGFGRLLRALSLDELPELINVLKGDMSLVGPRPLLMRYLPRYSEQQMHRHDVRPGITGWAQINGRNALSWEDKFEYDLWYVENQSIWLDMKILFLTLGKVVKREGISCEGDATMHEFMGGDDMG
jgi:lipopolysaccharide/colanic/teichoic acid biosynthesis glycosyltransferase